MDGRRRGQGGLISVGNNKQQILDPEWSMFKVGTPPPNNSDKPHGLVDSINNNSNNNPLLVKNIFVFRLRVNLIRLPSV